MEKAIAWSVTTNAIKTGAVLINKEKRKELIDQFLRMVRSNRKIVVFGISGAGKTQFVNSLQKNLIIPQRTVTTDKVSYELDSFPIVFYDTPGHSARFSERQREIKDIIKNGVEGIINVTSYGYEENTESNLSNIFDKNGTVKKNYLSTNRKLELDRLSEWLPLINSNDVNWIVNLVTKSDLWWGEKEEVQEYYESGLYFEPFKLLENSKNVITLPYCSIIKPFYNHRTSGLFGEIEKEILVVELIHQLSNLLIKSKGKWQI
jgi:hypothetical protein